MLLLMTQWCQILLILGTLGEEDNLLLKEWLDLEGQ